MSSSTTNTVIIKIKDKSPLCVDSTSLIENSSVFKRLICELNQTEIELTDFEPETVELFFTLLSDKTLSEIEKKQFRELHKLAVSFNVCWLKTSCRDWLEGEIDEAQTDLEQFNFVFEESMFILDTWRVQKFVGMMISKYSTQDNGVFYKNYMSNFNKMEESKLEVLLMLAGRNPAQLLTLPIEKLNNRRCVISKKTRFLLEKMNLALLYEQTPDEHLKLFEGLKEIPELSRDDLKFTLDMMTKSAKEVLQRAEVSTKISQITSKGNKWASFFQDFGQSIPDTLDEITNSISERKINDMELITLLLIRACLRSPPTEDMSENFLMNLVNLSKYKGYSLREVSADDIDLLVESLKGSSLSEKNQCISLLREIRDTFSLTSYNEKIRLRGKRLWDWKNQSSVQEYQSTFTILRRQLILSIDECYRYAFVFKPEEMIPGVRNCEKAGRCGFIVETQNLSGASKLELCTTADKYQDSGIHHHGIHSAEKMESFFILEGTSSDGRQRRAVPSWWAYGGEWFPDIDHWRRREVVITYDTSDFLARRPINV